jgi:hypothetical protein
MPVSENIKKTVFVVMPFNATPSRSSAQLTSYFDQLKNYLENISEGNLFVHRSDDTLNINEKIIKDLFSSDYVICDLSGTESNPNVMYELGVRFGLTEKPVILIREGNANNKPIFDISGFFTYSYDPMNYPSLFEYIKKKIGKHENKEEEYESPVINIIRQGIPALRKRSVGFAQSQLVTLAASLMFTRHLFLASIHEYFDSTKQDFDLGDKPSESIGLINNNLLKFSKIDFSKFEVEIPSNVLIDFLISNQYLRDLVPGDGEATYVWLAIEFNMQYLGTSHKQGHWNGGKITDYLRKSTALNNATNLYISALQVQSKEMVLEKSKKVMEMCREVSLVGGPNENSN